MGEELDHDQAEVLHPFTSKARDSLAWSAIMDKETILKLSTFIIDLSWIFGFAFILTRPHGEQTYMYSVIFTVWIILSALVLAVIECGRSPTPTTASTG